MNCSRELKYYFVLGLTLVRVPLILLFLAVSISLGHRCRLFGSWSLLPQC